MLSGRVSGMKYAGNCKTAIPEPETGIFPQAPLQAQGRFKIIINTEVR